MVLVQKQGSKNTKNVGWMYQHHVKNAGTTSVAKTALLTEHGIAKGLRKAMRKNEYRERLDSNGYAPSILQSQLDLCYLCGRSNCKLDRHECYSGAYRQKSKRLGAWVMLCHDGCHLGAYGVHYNADTGRKLKKQAQVRLMYYYHWSEDDFIKQFGKNYLID